LNGHCGPSWKAKTPTMNWCQLRGPLNNLTLGALQDALRLVFRETQREQEEAQA
jgi:hypothetical protein